MSKYSYELADGRSVEVDPSVMTDETKAWLKQQGATGGPSVWKDVGKSALSGLVEGAIRTPLMVGDLGNLAVRGINKMSPGSIDPEYEKMTSDRMLQVTGVEDKLHLPETTAGRYANSVGNTLGGSVLGGSGAFRIAQNFGSAPGVGNLIKALMSRTLRTPATVNAATGVGAEFAGDVSRKFDESQSQNPLARFAGSMTPALIAAIGGRFASPKLGPPLHEATKDITAANWAQAQAETQRLQRAGATQNTVGDSLPPTSLVPAVEHEASNMLGGTALRAKLVGRSAEGGDIPRLLGEAKADMQGAILPGGVPSQNRPRLNDESVLGAAINSRSNARQGVLAGAPLVPREDIVRMLAEMRHQAMRPANRGSPDAQSLREGMSPIRNLPLYPRGPVPPGPGTMPANGISPVTPLGPGPQGPPMWTAPPGQVLPGGAPPANLPGLPAPAGPPSTALALPQGGPLGPGVLPRGADSGFKMAGGPPDITDLNFLPPRAPTGVNLEALSKVLKSLKTAPPSTDPNAVAATQISRGANTAAYNTANSALKTLSPPYKQAMDLHSAMSPQVELADLLASNKMRAIPSSATSSMAQDNVREMIAKNMTAIDAHNAKTGIPGVSGSIREKLRTADVLARNTGERGVESLSNQITPSLGETAAGPFNAMRRISQLGSKLNFSKDVARLLGNPTPENYRILMELSRRDPGLAAVMREVGLMGGVSATSQTTGSNP